MLSKMTTGSLKRTICGNRLFSLPRKLVEKIFEYDDTDKKNFDRDILLKVESRFDDNNDEFVDKYLLNFDKFKGRSRFYRTILNKKRCRFEYRKKFCELISCGECSSWFSDDDYESLKYPFPEDLKNIGSRLASKVNVKRNVYEFEGKRYFFVRCDMEIREFVKELYRFLGEPEHEEFEMYFFTDWEDKYESHSVLPEKGGVYSYFDEFVEKDKYKKIMLMGDGIDGLCNLNLFADKNEHGKDIVYIQVDMDIFAIEDEVQNMLTGFVSPRRFNEMLYEIYNRFVHSIIQINKKYVAENIFTTKIT